MMLTGTIPAGETKVIGQRMFYTMLLISRYGSGQLIRVYDSWGGYYDVTTTSSIDVTVTESSDRVVSVKNNTSSAISYMFLTK